MIGMNQIRFIEGVGGKYVVTLIILIAGGVYTFFGLASAVGDGELERFDTALLLYFRQPGNLAAPLGPHWLQQTMLEITALGSYPVLVTLVAAVAGFLLVARNYGLTLFMLLTIISGTLISHALKIFYDRPRPDVVDHLAEAYTASFPSGHAMMSTVVYLTLAALIMRLADGAVMRVYVLAVAMVLAFTVGVSRIYLGVHWPSDVLAGWALGTAWVSLSWLTVLLLRNRWKY